MLRRILISAVISMIALVNANAQSDVTLRDVELLLSEANKEMPMYANEDVDVTSFSLNKTDKCLEFNFQIKKASVTASYLNQRKEAILNTYMNVYKEDPDSRALLNVIKKFGYGARLIFTDKAGNKCFMDYPSYKL